MGTYLAWGDWSFPGSERPGLARAESIGELTQEGGWDHILFAVDFGHFPRGWGAIGGP